MQTKALNFSTSFAIVCVIILFGATLINAQEVEDEREFDYSKKSEKGPTRWGEMKEEWAACNKGAMQSPIDLSHERVKIISKNEKRDYRASNATLRNRGHDIQIQWFGDAGSIYINHNEYHLQQAHWHSPSEHTIHGRRYDLELHLVHQDELRNKTAVVGILYKIGKPDKFLSRLVKDISSMIDNHEERILGKVDPKNIKMHSKRYYRYMGSLTVPPCTEGVVWTINKKVRSVSRDQVKLLREAVHDYAEENARPLQSRNDRDIFIYGPESTN